MIRTELQIQGQNELVELEDRKRIFKHSTTLFGVYSFTFIVLILILRYAESQYEDCGQDVKKYMNFCMFYFGVCACRQLIIVVLICFTKKPQRTSDAANTLFIAFDAIFVSSITFWGTTVLFDEESDGCRNSGDNWVILMYIFSILCLLYGWIYVILLCCGMTSLTLLLIFWCCYRRQLSSLSEQMGVQPNQDRNSGSESD